MKKAIAAICCALLACTGCVWGAQMMAQEENSFSTGAVLPPDHLFTTMDEEGRLVIMDTAQMEAQTAQHNASAARQRGANVKEMRAITHGVVNFRTKNSASLNTSYTEVGTGYSGYTNGYYAADAAFLGYQGTKVKFMLSGVVGLVNASEVEVLDADGSDTLYVSFYRCEQGMLKHYIKNDMHGSSYASAVTVGEQQSYMKSNQVYYSYDGHYFYTDYNTMLDDYKADTRKHAINPDDPYYNYYQFVSNRTKTSFTANDIDQYVKHYLGSRYSASGTKLYQMGRYFIQNQDRYGANALALFGVSANESAFGTSSIAMSKNNLFGHNAVDADPGQANGYRSPRTASLTMRDTMSISGIRHRNTVHITALSSAISRRGCSAMPLTHIGERRRRTGPGSSMNTSAARAMSAVRRSWSRRRERSISEKRPLPPRPCFTRRRRAETCPSSCWMR